MTTKNEQKLDLQSISPKQIFDLLKQQNLLNIPKQLMINDIVVASDKTWAKLSCVDSEAYAALKALGKEDLLSVTDVKLSRYAGEDLTSLVGKNILTSSLDLEFLKNRFGQPEGACFRTRVDLLELA